MSTPVAQGQPIEERLAAAGLPPLPRLSWLEIDVDALASNLRVTRQAAGGEAAVAAVVKADAYGHGLEAASRAFVDAGADRLCVATFDEALRLRDAGVTDPLLVLFRAPAQVVGEAAERGVELAISEEGSLDELLAEWQDGRHGRAANADLVVHVEVETGLGRAGLRPERVAQVVARLTAAPGVRIAGLWTHLASPGERAATAAQVAAFERAVDGVRHARLPIPARHVSASGSVFAATAPSYEQIRPGLCLYGLLPDELPVADELAELGAGLRPALQLKARPLRVESMSVGEGVSYGSRWRAERPSLVATLPVGYADGWPRLSWPGGVVLVRGRRAPLVGTVAMDAVMVDVTEIPGVDLACEFTFIGRDGDAEITVNEVARSRNTISWEVVACLAQRLPRVYHRGPVLVGRRTLTGETDDGVAR